MTDRLRLRLFLVFGGIFLGLYCYAAANLPAWGYYRGPYGDTISRMAVYERHATDSVNAINYDYRGFDTLGEEFILFTAVLGVMLLLRREDETGDNSQASSIKVSDTPRLSTTIQAIALPAVFVTVIFGFYIGLHGQLTPGGGFQAGVILATAPLLIYVSPEHQSFQAHHIAPGHRNRGSARCLLLRTHRCRPSATRGAPAHQRDSARHRPATSSPPEPSR